jgi:RNA polymerase sigma factor (sigma-70 family)
VSVALRVHESSPSDEELVVAVAAGELSALGALFDRHEPEIRRYLGRLGVQACDADDLVQTTFLEVVHAAPRFDPSLPARSWLMGIATMMVRRHRQSIGRTLARLGTWLTRTTGTVAPPQTPAEVLASDENTRRLLAALDTLSPKKREVFALVVLEELSGEEAARALAIPVNTVWTRLHHARRELRAALGGEP